VVVVFAATAGRWAFAGAVHVSAFHDVAQTFGGAVVFAPAVFNLWVAEAHVVEELLFELFHPSKNHNVLQQWVTNISQKSLIVLSWYHDDAL
jgi:hypothetical protein